MGKKRTRSEQTNKPVYGAQIEGAANNITSAYNASQPAVQNVSNNLNQASNDLFAQFRNGGDPTVSAASSFLRNQIESDPTQNPYLDAMVERTNNSVRNQQQAIMGRRGLTGGSDYTNIINRALASNETGLRFDDYNQSMNRRMQAAGMAPGIAQAGYLPLQMATQAGTAGAMLPSQLAALQGAGIGGLLGQYQNVKGTQTQSGMGWGELLGAGMQAASLFSDRRLKTDIRRVGTTDGGLGIYQYKYVWGGPEQIGVMAQEVQEKQPDALGPVVDGYMTVRYDLVS